MYNSSLAGWPSDGGKDRPEVFHVYERSKIDVMQNTNSSKFAFLTKPCALGFGSTRFLSTIMPKLGFQTAPPSALASGGKLATQLADKLTLSGGSTIDLPITAASGVRRKIRQL